MAVRTTYFFGSYSSKYLLDKYRNATVGYSLRKLRAGYTGSAIRVIRDSDNDYLDVGFDNDELDVSSLMSFIGAGTAFVHTWYFQGLVGEGIDAVQAVKANMPRIVHNGVIETLNGKPALNFMANQYFDLGNNSRYNTDNRYSGACGYVVASFDDLSRTVGIFGRSTPYNNQGRSNIIYEKNLTTIRSLRGSTSVHSSLSPLDVSTQYITGQLIKYNINTVFVNGVDDSASISLSNNGNVGRYFIGVCGDVFGNAPMPGWYLDGKMQELVQFYNDKSAVQLYIRDEINNYYGAY